MKSGHWVSTIFMAAVVAAMPRPVLAQNNAPVATPADAAERDLRQQEAVLSEGQSTQSQRDEAARRLVSRQRPEAKEILRRALLDSGNPAAQIAAARALATDPNPDPMFIDSLFDLLGRNRTLTEAAAHALATYKGNPQVLGGLVRAAQEYQRGEGPRIAVIRSIGTLVEKPAAEALINLLRGDANPAIRNAAADALVEMTGLRENGRDVQRWLRWWDQHKDESNEAWRSQLLNLNTKRYVFAQNRLEQLSDQVRILLTETYRRAPEAQRPDVLLRYLQNPEPEIRTIGAGIVYDERLNAQPIARTVVEQLRNMVGDSSVQVRKRVAQALGAINDPGAVDAMLAQLAQESDPDVRAAIAAALGPTNDVRAVPALLKVLGDPDPSAARAAAESLGRDLGDEIRQNPELENQVLAQLTDALDKANRIAATPLRESIVEAMGSLHDPRLLKTFLSLLRPTESNTVRIRRIVAEALGQLDDATVKAAAAEGLVNALHDQDAGVRLEAVQSIGNIGSFDQAEPLYQLLSADNETDARVRSEAWNVLGTLFRGSEVTIQQLYRWADRFPNSPERRLVVLEALAEKLSAAGQLDELAYARQNIGQTLMLLDKPEEAAIRFRGALDYWKERNKSAAITEPLMRQLMESLLRARRYQEAMQFASESITGDSKHIETMGSRIQEETARLMQNGELQDALRLVDEAEKMKPPLEGFYAKNLSLMKRDIQARLTGPGAPPS